MKNEFIFACAGERKRTQRGGKSGPGRVHIVDRMAANLRSKGGYHHYCPRRQVRCPLARFGEKPPNHDTTKAKKTSVPSSPSMPAKDGRGARTSLLSTTVRTIPTTNNFFSKRKNCSLIRQRASLTVARATAAWAETSRSDNAPPTRPQPRLESPYSRKNPRPAFSPSPLSPQE